MIGYIYVLFVGDGVRRRPLRILVGLEMSTGENGGS
jgi:hypothetical protein